MAHIIVGLHYSNKECNLFFVVEGGCMTCFSGWKLHFCVWENWSNPMFCGLKKIAGYSRISKVQTLRIFSWLVYSWSLDPWMELCLAKSFCLVKHRWSISQTIKYYITPWRALDRRYTKVLSIVKLPAFHDNDTFHSHTLLNINLILTSKTKGPLG